MEGEDTEIDRNMVETINDSLVHMLRNSVDHGIESPEVRKAAGKPETGTVLLRAYHTAGNIVIELHDDGKGLDRTRIFNKAVEKKLVDPEHTLSDSEVFKLIFLPGFSTAEKVTEVSGRGVGLDVVKKNIESIRGRIEINSTPGQNTLFAMRIPLTLAIIDGMLLKVGAQQYLLPTLNVKHAFRPEASALFTVTGKGEMVKLRDK
jgi:two-component system chemotaxis sensor kinase CheA